MDLRYAAASGAGRPRIEMTLSLDGVLTPEQGARLREVSSRCPVHRMLSPGVDISHG